jgi:type IV pilus assembly protein PilE
MSTFPAYNLSRQSAFSMTELLLVLIIIGVLATVAVVGWQPAVEKEYKDNAKATLKALLRAQETFFSWKGRYTNNWTSLEIDDPNVSDNAYNYTLENVTGDSLFIRATRRGNGYGVIIDQDGNIAEF